MRKIIRTGFVVVTGLVAALAIAPAGSQAAAAHAGAETGSHDPCIRTVRVYQDDEGFWHGVGYNCSLYGGNRSLRYADGLNHSPCAFVEGKAFHDWIIPPWAAQGPITMVAYCV
ncbi:hypothetical protein ABGB17_16185 [Sphaerisporangium sp. B11E5]|uniref:hypothetical protein n=1 Tax=Sphaerisporangium sp. B11E5 TaxID=3153563 RepID=UPI00325DF7FE